MDRYAIIEDGLVINVVIGQPELAPNQILVECENAGPSWTYADGVFTAPVVVEPTVVTPTREELLVQLNALSAQIQAVKYYQIKIQIQIVEVLFQFVINKVPDQQQMMDQLFC